MPMCLGCYFGQRKLRSMHSLKKRKLTQPPPPGKLTHLKYTQRGVSKIADKHQLNWYFKNVVTIHVSVSLYSDLRFETEFAIDLATSLL